MTEWRRKQKAEGLPRKEYFVSRKRHKLLKKISELTDKQADAIEALVEPLALALNEISDNENQKVSFTRAECLNANGEEVRKRHSRELSKAFMKWKIKRKCKDGSYTVRCKKGFWSVYAPTEEQAMNQAMYYFVQYYEDGEYNEPEERVDDMGESDE